MLAYGDGERGQRQPEGVRASSDSDLCRPSAADLPLARRIAEVEEPDEEVAKDVVVEEPDEVAESEYKYH